MANRIMQAGWTRALGVAALGLSGVALTACGRFAGLQQDLADYDHAVMQVRGEVATPGCDDCMVVLVVIGRDGRAANYKVFERDGAFDLLVDRDAQGLFAFHDRDGDLTHDPNEATADLPLHGQPPEDGTPVRLELKPGGATRVAAPKEPLFAVRTRVASGVNVQLGTVIDLADPRFDPDNATQGVWQPVRFMQREWAGIYFLEPYDKRKTPVLFVHGIYGSPREFETLAKSLDPKRYQAWFLYYPSGLDLGVLGSGSLALLNGLWAEYRFDSLHIVAHSMGGLVSRSLMRTCALQDECDYVRTLTTLSSPFGGIDSAQSGVEYAPVTVPSWRSLAPSSTFLAELFSTPLPKGVEHHLLFGFANSARLSRTSGDGVVPLASQLRPEAQAQASTVLGIDENHTGILRSDAACHRLIDILDHDARRGPLQRLAAK